MSDNNDFTLEVDGKLTTFTVKKPSFKDQREGQKIYNQTFSDSVKSGCIIRAKLDDLMKDQGLWDDKKEKEFKSLQSKILETEKILARGGISLTAARNAAIEMKKAREELKDLIATRTNLDSHTAEGQADNARFNYLVSACVVYKDDNKPYFKGYEDYINRAIEPISILGAQKLANIIYGLDGDFEKNLPENKFLRKYKFIDENLNFIDKQGRLTDAEGRLIDADGNFINDKGQRIDINGDLVDNNGDFLVEFKPFVDDSGNPVEITDNEQKENTTKDK
jgi:hypothetical protein